MDGWRTHVAKQSQSPQSSSRHNARGILKLPSLPLLANTELSVEVFTQASKNSHAHLALCGQSMKLDPALAVHVKNVDVGSLVPARMRAPKRITQSFTKQAVNEG